MSLENTDFYFAWPEWVSIEAQINWTIPSTHDVLFSGLIDADATAYFYAIVSVVKKEWITHYIGKVFGQSASSRHKNVDHLNRLEKLRLDYPGRTFHLSLGTPVFSEGKGSPDAPTIDQLEGLLIYSNWSEEMINLRKIEKFHCAQQISLENTGCVAHLCKRSAYGVFYNNE
jgi:hypothetical protein